MKKISSQSRMCWMLALGKAQLRYAAAKRIDWTALYEHWGQFSRAFGRRSSCFIVWSYSGFEERSRRPAQL